MTIGVADVMKYFNQGKMQWWGWEDTSAGEVYSNLKLLDDTAGKAKAARLHSKDAMYVSVIKQLITKIETLETKVQALEDA